MTFYADITFYAVALIAIVPAFLLGVMEKRIRIYAFAVSLVFIGLVYSKNPCELVAFVVFAVYALTLIGSYHLLRRHFGRKAWMYRVFLALSLGPLVLFKLAPFLQIDILGFLGISYITFKVLQILIETYDGVIKEFKLFETIAFLLFFAPLSAGPIDRSRRFAEDFNKRITRGDYLELFGSGLKKLMLGLCYKFVVAELLSGWLIAFIGKLDPLSLLAYIYLYGLNLFFDFAGYSLMAVGLSYMFAIRTPDNFKLPFISIDIKDFWNRWHITLSHWFRDFVFSRLMMSILRKKLFTSRLTGASIAMITNMALMGIWHGVSSILRKKLFCRHLFIAATEIYQKKSRFHHRYKNTRPYRLLSWFVTMNAVFLGFFIFSGEFIGLIGAVLGFPIS